MSLNKHTLSQTTVKKSHNETIDLSNETIDLSDETKFFTQNTISASQDSNSYTFEKNKVSKSETFKKIHQQQSVDAYVQGNENFQVFTQKNTQDQQETNNDADESFSFEKRISTQDTFEFITGLFDYSTQIEKDKHENDSQKNLNKFSPFNEKFWLDTTLFNESIDLSQVSTFVNPSQSNETRLLETFTNSQLRQLIDYEDVSNSNGEKERKTDQKNLKKYYSTQ